MSGFAFRKRAVLGSKVLLLMLMATVLHGCGSMESFQELKQKGDTIYVKGSLDTIKTAAVIALEESRLTSPTFEQIAGGMEIYAEQNVLAGMAFNSYGGYGKVTVVSGHSLEPGIFAVSAITRSRAAREPVGSQDAFKGNNFNNPLIARQMLERIRERVNAQTTN